MAVTLTAAQLAAAMRVGDSAEEMAEVERLLAYGTEAVQRHGPAAPDAVHNEAVVRLCGYLFDQPLASRRDAFANAIRNSGAARMMLPYVDHRVGATDEVVTGSTTLAADSLRQIGIETITVTAIHEWFSTTLPYPAASIFGVSVVAPDGTTTGIVLNLTSELLGGAVTGGGDATAAVGGRQFALGAASAGGALFFASTTTGAHVVRLFEA